MKKILRSIFSIVLNLFESGTGSFQYQKSHRVILIVIGFLFTGLASIIFYMAQGKDIGYFFPVLIFGSIGLLGFIIGFLGNDRAVATIWGNTDKEA